MAKKPLSMYIWTDFGFFSQLQSFLMNSQLVCEAPHLSYLFLNFNKEKPTKVYKYFIKLQFEFAGLFYAYKKAEILFDLWYHQKLYTQVQAFSGKGTHLMARVNEKKTFGVPIRLYPSRACGNISVSCHSIYFFWRHFLFCIFYTDVFFSAK